MTDVWKIEGVIYAESLLKAFAALKRSLDAPKDEFTRNSAIQCFEFTLGLTWKILKRVLENRKFTVTSPRETIRLAAREGLIVDASRWLEYFDLRNLTSHTYNEEVA